MRTLDEIPRIPSLWYMDGHRITRDTVGQFLQLEWGRAWIVFWHHVDRGPFPAGNRGPYYKVPRGDIIHRLYPYKSALMMSEEKLKRLYLERGYNVILPERKDPQAKWGKIIEMREQGHTLQQVGDEFNLTRERIRQILHLSGNGHLAHRGAVRL